MRVALAVVTGIAIGLGVSAICNAALYPPHDFTWPPNITDFWGLVYGSFSAVVTFGIALWLFHRRLSRPARIGRLIAMLTLGLFGLAVAWWIVMWGVPPFTLEGAWMYPLAAIPLIIGAIIARSTLRTSKTKRNEALEG